jgi:hypothetical protein
MARGFFRRSRRRPIACLVPFEGKPRHMTARETAHDADRCGPRSETDWAGIAFGVSLASLAAYQQFKLPPVLPLLLEHYGYDRALAGSFMSI